jgi:hypothetical protein
MEVGASRFESAISQVFGKILLKRKALLKSKFAKFVHKLLITALF